MSGLEARRGTRERLAAAGFVVLMAASVVCGGRGRGELPPAGLVVRDRDTATDIEPGKTVRGLVGAASMGRFRDVWYKLDAAAPSMLSATVKITKRDEELALELYRGQEAKALAADRAAGADGELEIAARRVEPGTYYLRVFARTNEAGSAFTLTAMLTPVAPPPPPPPPPPPAGLVVRDRNTATPVEAGKIIKGHVGKGSPHRFREDWYKLEVASAFDLQAAVKVLTPKEDLGLELYRGEETRALAADRSVGADKDLEIPSRRVEPGAYYLRVFARTNEAGSPYTLHVVLATIPPPPPPVPTYPVEPVTGLGTADDPAGTPAVVRGADRFHAWYVTRSKDVCAVRHAESQDGRTFRNERVCFWGRDAQSRISAQPVVFAVGNGWRMLLVLYNAVREGRDAIISLESADGLTWGRPRVVAQSADHCRRPAVVRSGNRWILFYLRVDRDFDEDAVVEWCQMTSSDGDEWRQQRVLQRSSGFGWFPAMGALHARRDPVERRWVLVVTETFGRTPGRHRFAVRLSDDADDWSRVRRRTLDLGLDPKVVAETATSYSFMEDGGRTHVYWSVGGRVSRQRVDVEAAVQATTPRGGG
jgi:hypothetical protein